MTTEPETKQLPHGGTVEEFRRERAQMGEAAVRARSELFKAEFAGSPAKKASDEALAQYELLVEAGANAWSVVVLLAWIDRKFGTDAAFEAAAIAQETGINGGPWDESLLDTDFCRVASSPEATEKGRDDA
jgi:hypothetical protein